MKLTRGQEKALAIALYKYRKKEPYTVIAGAAGVGKSFLVRFIISALELNSSDVAYVAYTGRAAQVLQQKGCPNATTLHQLLYETKRCSDGSFYHIPIPTEAMFPYRLIVVDEVSMVPQEMWELLLSHKIHVLALGDPYQLKPVSGKETQVLEYPDIFLSEILRQEAESEIIQVATKVRQGIMPSPFKGKEVNVVRAADFCDGMITWADQIICGRNNTRHSLNKLARELKWGKEVDLTLPIVGDKLVCLRNNWDRVSENGEALVNGLVGTATGVRKGWDPLIGETLTLDIMSESSSFFEEVEVDQKIFTDHVPNLTKENYKTIQWRTRKRLESLEQFDYGNAITCWKSQGSGWPKILFIAEKVGYMSREEYMRYLYTGITRAEKKLTLVMGG